MAEWRRTARQVAALAWPVLVAQLAGIGMMVIDTRIVGHYATLHLAAVAVGASLYVSLMLGLAGIVQALGPCVAQALGAGKTEQIGPWVRQGLWLSALLSVPGVFLLLNPHLMLDWVGVSPEVEALTAGYLQVLAICLPASLCYRTFHAAANAVGQPRPLMLLGLLQTMGHAVLALMLVPGQFGFPELGALGAAASQAVMSWVSCCGGLLILWKGKRWQIYRCFGAWSWPSLSQQKDLLRLGIPMGLSYMVEITAFTFVALFIARLGADVMSAHRIVANISVITYMLPLSIGTATSVLVAQSVGGGREAEARNISMVGMTMAAAGATLLGGLVWCFRETLATFASTDPVVAALAASLMFYVAIYQCADGIQTVAGFALRGYKVTFLPLLIHLTGFWGVGLGLGYVLAFKTDPPGGVAGFWQGTVLSTVFAALFLGVLLRWVMRNRQPLHFSQ